MQSSVAVTALGKVAEKQQAVEAMQKELEQARAELSSETGALKDADRKSKMPLRVKSQKPAPSNNDKAAATQIDPTQVALQKINDRLERMEKANAGCKCAIA